MKQTLICTAVLCALSGGASAQTSVTLYGIADGNLRFDHTNIGTLKSVDSGGESGTRWGIRGSEDLGNGLKANFIFEQGFDLSDNSSPQGNVGAGSSAGNGGSSTQPHSSTGTRLFSRIAQVGLSGDFGEFRIGRGYNPMFLINAYADPYAAGLVSGVVNIFPNSTSRNDNAIFYDTPRVYGIQGMMGYQLGESTTNNTVNAATGQALRGNDQLELGIRYSNGPLFVGTAYEHINSNLDNYKIQTYLAASTYDFGFVKLHALYWHTKTDNPNAVAAFGSTTRQFERTYFGGVTVPYGAWTFVGSFGHLHDSSRSNVTAVNLGSPSVNMIGASIKYSLSKRTVLYAAYGKFHLKNGPNGNPFVGFNGFLDASNRGLFTTANLTGPSGPNVTPYSYQLGIRQSF